MATPQPPDPRKRQPVDPQDVLPRPGCWFLATPIVMVVLVFVAYAIMISMGIIGRAADGALVRMDYQTCAEAEPMILSRVATMGLPEVSSTWSGGTFQLTARLPSDTDVADEIPKTLARPGSFQIRADGAETVLIDDSHVLEAGPRMDLTATPSAALDVDRDAAIALKAHMRSDPHGTISFYVDGERVDGRKNLADLTEAEIEVTPRGPDPNANLRIAAAWAVILNDGPLPCEAKLLGVTEL